MLEPQGLPLLLIDCWGACSTYQLRAFLHAEYVLQFFQLPQCSELSFVFLPSSLQSLAGEWQDSEISLVMAVSGKHTQASWELPSLSGMSWSMLGIFLARGPYDIHTCSCLGVPSWLPCPDFLVAVFVRGHHYSSNPPICLMVHQKLHTLWQYWGATEQSSGPSLGCMESPAKSQKTLWPQVFFVMYFVCFALFNLKTMELEQ